MMTLNTIKTDAEYRREGYTTEEIPMIRKHDELFNQYQLQSGGGNWELTETEWEEYNHLVKTLKI